MTRSTRKPGSSDPEQPSNPEARGERRLVRPFRCRIWTQHSRPEEQLTEHACQSLRESIAKNGQHQPALGRPVTDDPDYDVEIICGARRHAVALALGRDLLVDVRIISDAAAYVAMYEENAERADDCPYVQGQILRRALQTGTCASQDDLASTFGLSHSRTSRLLMVGQLPSVIVAAFQSPTDLRESWGVRLYQLWKDGDQDHAIAGKARALATKHPRPQPCEVYEILIGTYRTDGAQHRMHRSIPVRGSTGAILFREEERIANVLFTVPKATLTTGHREAMTQALVKILDRPNVRAQASPPGKPTAT